MLQCLRALRYRARMRRIFRAIAIALFAVSAARADDWPQWRGPNRDGISNEKGIKTTWPAEGPEKVWETKIGVGWSSMSVAKDRLYAIGNTEDRDIVFCLNAHTGNQIWKHTYSSIAKDPNGYPGPRSTPTIDDDRVYAVSRHGQLFCLNAETGAVIWKTDYITDFQSTPPTWGFAGSPLIEGDLLIAEIGAKDAAVVAFNKKTGAIVWKSKGEKAGYASPVAYTQNGVRHVLTFSAYGLESRKVKDGALTWRHPWKTNYDVNAATPVVVGEKVFLASAYGVGGAVLDFSSGQPVELWKHKQMAVHMSGPVFWGGHLYGFDEFTLRCVDFNTGATKWAEKKYGKGSLLLADGKLIVYGGQGQLGLVEASPARYKEIAFAQVLGGKDTWAPPVLANGLLYLRSLETLACFDLRGKVEEAKWEPLFTEDGPPKGWKVREWSDIRRPAPEGVKWEVKNGVLNGSDPRGTWLISDKEYGDFELEFEFKLGRRGNSGVALRSPDYGDPAFDGLELQMVDPRYYPPEMQVPDNELTGGLYRAIAAKQKALKAEDWNKYHIKLVGSKVNVTLNGTEILDVDLSQHTTMIKRHNGEDADPLRARPRRGRIGFQELSREGGHVEIRNARIKVLN